MLKFNWNGLGDIDQVSGQSLTNTNVEYKRTEKGMAGFFPATTDDLKLKNGIPLDFANDTFSIVLAFKKIATDNDAIILGDFSSASYFVYSVTSYLRLATTAGNHDFNSISSGVNEWKLIVINCTGGSTTAYDLLEDVNETVAVTGTFTVDIIGDRFSATAGLIGFIKTVQINDALLSQNDRDDILEKFLNAPILTETNYWEGLEATRKPSTLNEDGLVAAYNMIPSTGGVLVDTSNNGNDGDIQGPISSLNGLKFDGVDDYIDLDSDIQFTGDFGVSFRAKRSDAGEAVIVGNDTSNIDSWIIFSVGSLFVESDTNGDFAVSSGITDDANIHNYTITRESGVVKMYEDGTPLVLSDSAMTGTITFNRFGAAQSSVYLTGDIRNVRFYNRSLSAQEAKDYHNQFNLPTFTEDYRYLGDGEKALNHKAGTGTYGVKTVALVDEDLSVNLRWGEKYYECTSSGTESFFIGGTSSFSGNGYVKRFLYYNGSSWSDVGGDTLDNVVSANAWLSFSDGRLTINLTSGQRIAKIFLQQGEPK